MADYAVFYKVGLDGVEKAKSALGSLYGGVRNVGIELQKIGNRSALAFGGLTASIIGFTRAASPRTVDEFSASVGILSGSVGMIFIPLIRQATGYIMGLAKWFYGLSSAQRDNVLYWTKIALGVTGILMLLPKAISLFNVLMSVATSPLLMGIMAIAGAIGMTLKTMKDMEDHANKLVERLERMRGGNVTQKDIDNSTVGKELMAIKDPKERARQAQLVIDKETKRNQEQAEAWNKKSTMGMGLSSIGNEWFGMETDYSRHKQTQDEVANNIGVAKAILDQALSGKDLKLSKEPDKPANPFAGIMAGMGQDFKSVSVGGIADAQRRIQSAQIESPQEKLMREANLILKRQEVLMEQQVKQGTKPVSILSGIN
ncbi:MAG: hypothetical protein QM703_22730 [Gemmatales bacterium]